MWVEESYYKNDMVSFRELYKYKIKTILATHYHPYPSFIKLPISYETVESEIKHLLQSYKTKTYYTPRVQLYSIHNNKKLSRNIPVTTRLNALSYIIKMIPNAYYHIVPTPTKILYPTLYRNSTCSTTVKIACVMVVFIVSIILYYKNVGIVKNTILCSSILLIVCVLWKL